MAIVANRGGGIVLCPGGPLRVPDGRDAVRARSWAEVAAVVSRFAALNPYGSAAVPGSVLKVEDLNYEGNFPGNAAGTVGVRHQRQAVRALRAGRRWRAGAA